MPRSKHIGKIILTLIILAFTPGALDARVISLLGDSMTWIGGDNCEKPTGWSHWLKLDCPDDQIDTYARSGATWTNTSNTRGDVNHYTALLDDENVIYNQVRRLINAALSDAKHKPDIIIIFAGGNDAMFASKRPGLFDNRKFPDADIETIHPRNITDMAGSIELCIRLLSKHFPNARIILVTPTQMSKVTEEMTHKVSDLIDKTGKSLGVQVLRADKEVDIKHDIELTKQHRYTYDGIHSNPKGARLIADYILREVKLN